MEDDDRVFKALADPTRRHLLDQLFERDGRTLGELQAGVDMTRFGVMKHLGVLEDAQLITTRKSGREKLHYLNPVPIRLIHDRWIDKYTERRVSALTQLKSSLEKARRPPRARSTRCRCTRSSFGRPLSRSGTPSRNRNSPASTFTAPESTRPPRPARRSATTRRTATCGATTRSWNPTHRAGWW